MVLACSRWLTVNTQSVRFLVCLKARWRGDRKSTRTHRVAAFTRSSVPATPPSSCACENSSRGCPLRVWPETGENVHSDSGQGVVLLRATKRISDSFSADTTTVDGNRGPRTDWLFGEHTKQLRGLTCSFHEKLQSPPPEPDRDVH